VNTHPHIHNTLHKHFRPARLCQCLCCLVLLLLSPSPTNVLADNCSSEQPQQSSVCDDVLEAECDSGGPCVDHPGVNGTTDTSASCEVLIPNYIACGPDPSATLSFSCPTCTDGTQTNVGVTIVHLGLGCSGPPIATTTWYDCSCG
jgi:hypothetical protein